ncbi:MAG: YciI family protein [Acidobacteriota bacterium]|nr:YciI family protein [Acidobacteriota bacterium]
MQYLLMIYGEEAAATKLTPEQMQAMYGRYVALTNEMKEKGVYIGGNPLQPTATATSVRVRDGQAAITDGPFAETKEQLAGYYLVDCKDLDEALDYAARIPGAALGTIEVRPVRPMPPA